MPAFGAQGLRFTCQQTGHCCTARHDGVGYVYLSVEDRERLAAHLGLTLEDFVARHCQVSAGDLHLADPQRPCGFRDGHHCGVYEARPTQCRTWPFWPENMSEATWNEAARTCPGMGQGKLYSLEEVRAQVQETRRAMARTAARLAGTPPRGDPRR
jgi:Fe-S-cluster containining protein